MIPRAARRSRHHRRAVLSALDHEDRSCVVLDISEAGAKILVDGDAAIPHHFDLSTSVDGGPRRCELIWWRGKTAGLKFV